MIDEILKEVRWIGKVSKDDDSFSKEFYRYKILLNKMRNKKSIGKLTILFDNPRIKRPDIYWARIMDKSEPRSIELKDLFKNIRIILKRKYPVSELLRKILDYGLLNGHFALNRVISKGRIRFDILKEKEIKVEKQISVEDSKKEFEKIEVELKEKTKNLFEEEPTQKDLKKLKESNPEVYKEFSRLKREKTKAVKNVNISVFQESKTETMDVDSYKRRMKSLKVEIYIDSGFVGNISKQRKLLTSDNKLLTAVVGKDVKMNSKYDEILDNTYYCTSINSSGKVVHHYTEDFMLKHKKEKFLKNLKFGESIGGLREQVNEDLDSPNKKLQTEALMVTLVDQAYFRIGNSASEKKNVRGLHNLQVKHLRIDNKDRLHFSYTGKDMIHQHKIIADEKITNMIKELIKNKKPSDYIFTFDSKGKQKKVRPGDINSYMKNRLKSPVTIHKFRTFHATRIAKEMLDKIKIVPTITKDKIIKVFKKIVDSIAKLLGHNNSNTTVKHYIDTSVLQSFFNKFKIEPPKVVANLVVANVNQILKLAESDYVRVVSDKTVTDDELKFNDWMETLSPKIMERDAIDIKGKVDSEEQYFI